MEGYIISVQGGSLKVSIVGTENVAEKEVASNLSDHEVFAQELGKLILSEFGPKPQKLPLNFLISPKDLHLSFLTISKRENSETELLDLTKSSLAEKGIAIENVYYSHQKIAPFVYQLVAIDKDVLEKYLQIATDLGLELRSVLFWPMFLPRHVASDGKPTIFILNSDGETYLMLSELGGIYHIGPLTDAKDPQNLQELVKSLSVYERSEPITDIYTLNLKDLILGGNYKVKKLGVDNIHSFVAEKCANPSSLTAQSNLLNMLPLPEPARKIAPAVYAATVVGILLLVGAIFGYKSLKREVPSDQIAQEQTETPVVLSEQEEVIQEEDEVVEETTPDLDLNKAYLRIRVENGTLIGGLAGKTRDHLSEFGYEVVEIGDAEESDHTTTLLKFNKDNILYKNALIEDLKELYEDVKVTEDLGEELGYDVLIIIGNSDDDSQE